MGTRPRAPLGVDAAGERVAPRSPPPPPRPDQPPPPRPHRGDRDPLAPQPGQTILDLAAGTGETGFLAAQRGAALISSDLSTSMLEAAERLAPSFGVSAEFRRLDTDAIELPDATVDGVLSRFGYVL